MRHILSPRPIAMGTLRMGNATTAARLVPLSGLTQPLAPDDLGAAAGAIDLAAIAAVCARCTPSRRRVRARLWVCGQRKSVAHIPTGATSNKQQQFDCFAIAGLTPNPSHPGRHQSGGSRDMSPASRRHILNGF